MLLFTLAYPFFVSVFCLAFLFAMITKYLVSVDAEVPGARSDDGDATV